MVYCVLFKNIKARRIEKNTNNYKTIIITSINPSGHVNKYVKHKESSHPHGRDMLPHGRKVFIFDTINSSSSMMATMPVMNIARSKPFMGFFTSFTTSTGIG